jgi:hypothetical protein
MNIEFKLIRHKLILRMASHRLKNVASHPVPGMSNEKRE